MTEFVARRRRPAVSCTLCRRRKLRCDRQAPCSNCMRSSNAICVYNDAPSQPREVVHTHGTSSPSRRPTALTASRKSPSTLVAALTPASTIRSQPPSAADVETIQSKIQQLEDQLSRASASSIQPPCWIEEADSHIGGTYHVHRQDRTQRIARSVTHKTRLYGQSCWVVGVPLLKDFCDAFESHLWQDVSRAFSGMQRYKTLARRIKSQRAPLWPTPPTPDLPPKDVADKLIDCYLRTSETVFRILHVTTFKRDYEALWTSTSVPDPTFVVQLKLVLAIGATMYDDHFSLRPSAVRWVYEAKTWLSEPGFKSRLVIPSLQTILLLLLARETAAVDDDFVWITAGALLRRAIYMGLHRDPVHLPTRTTFAAAEMRRRLWNTIIELNLQSSITCGGPPLLSLDDFDTAPPGNFDDDQLLAQDPVPEPEHNFTQASIAIALRKTFPLRLAVAKLLNRIGSYGTYDDTLRLDRELRASYKAVRLTLQACASSTGAAHSRFAMSAVDFIMHRYLSALHVPYFAPALHETVFAFSRKVVVETSLKIWCAAYSPPSAMPGEPTVPHEDDLPRLVRCGNGFFRTVAMHAAILIAAECKTQLQEDDSLGPPTLRPDLLTVLDDSKTWCLRCIEAGETNIKGYLLMSVLVAQVTALRQGLGKDEIAGLLVRVAEDAGETCSPLLERLAGLDGGDGADVALPDVALSTPSAEMGDWDFTMSHALFSPGTTDPMSWVFHDEPMQMPSFW